MAEVVECDKCGAVLGKEDLFCGECGASRPLPPPPSEPEEEGVVAAVSPAPHPIPPSDRARTAWRTAVLVLGIVGAFLCLLGLAAFLLFGLTESEVASQQENWLYSTFCCLLPIAGSGAILAAAGAGIWWFRLRNR